MSALLAILLKLERPLILYLVLVLSVLLEPLNQLLVTLHRVHLAQLARGLPLAQQSAVFAHQALTLFLELLRVWLVLLGHSVIQLVLPHLLVAEHALAAQPLDL
jgi:hypothetical protein